MAANNRLRNPFNPPETVAGDAFPGMAKAFQEDHQYQAHYVKELVDGAGSASTADSFMVVTETTGLYLLVARDPDATTTDATLASGGNLAVVMFYWNADAGTASATDLTFLIRSDATDIVDDTGVGDGATNDQLNFVRSGGALSLHNQMGVDVEVWVARLI